MTAVLCDWWAGAILLYGFCVRGGIAVAAAGGGASLKICCGGFACICSG
jgi:hypothetical protein